MTLVLHGVPVSRGVAMGRVHLVRRDAVDIDEYALKAHEVEAEVARFDAAVAAARQQLDEIRAEVPATARANIVAFIDSHLLMLDDPVLTSDTRNAIRTQRCNAEWALKLQAEAILAVFDEMQDAYLKTRRDDVQFVVDRIQRVLKNAQPAEQALERKTLTGSVIVADDLSPADTVLLDTERVAAFATEYGGPTSHTAIIARSLNLPGVVGLSELGRYVQSDDELIIDGETGVVLINPDPEIRAFYLRKQEQLLRYQTVLADLTNKASVSLDGVAVTLNANVELPSDYDSARRYQAHGVGLYRTEFLYMNRTDGVPTEEEHYAAYAALIAKLKGRPVTIRTVDLGADKPLNPGAPQHAVNPALGLRAIRLCLKSSELFRPQVRAILRASALGPVKLMIPMLSSIQELEQTFEIIDALRAELRAENEPFDPHMPVGGMVEVPAAAVCADAFAARLDFLSIGTNDLIQYTMAIDRVDDQVSYLYDPLNLGVLRLIQTTIDAGLAVGIPVAMCGEMAGDPTFVRLLLGMGLREFSVHPNTLLEVKKLVRETDVGDVTAAVREALSVPDPYRVRALVERLNIGN